jgi:inner membrane protein involved in colicin E2 resistance
MQRLFVHLITMHNFAWSILNSDKEHLQAGTSIKYIGITVFLFHYFTLL